MDSRNFVRSCILEGNQLIAKYESELDAVESVEQKMSEITSLLSSFADLIHDQSETIQNIADNSTKAKEEVEKGEDQLRDAKERGDSNQYFIPLFILLLSWILLFLNWFTP